MGKQKKASGTVCWICHQKGYFSDIYQPCECKGSMQFVHESCLNSWAQEKYGNLLLRDKFDPRTDVQCPNCKFSYRYTITEGKKIGSFSQMKFFDQREKIILFLLIVIQLIVVLYDSYLIFLNEREEGTWNLNLSRWDVIHFGTVSILLAAATYNFLEMGFRCTTIQILSKHTFY